MSKKTEPSYIQRFLIAFSDLDGQVRVLVTQTCLTILSKMFDDILIGFFEVPKDNISYTSSGIDKSLKSEISHRMEEFLTQQAIDCSDELDGLPEEIWENEKANVQVFSVTYSATNVLYSLKAGSMFRKVRAVIQRVANEQGRIAAWNLLHADNALELFNEQLQSYDSRATSNGDGSTADSETTESGDTSPDDGGNTVHMPDNVANIVVDAYKALGHELAQSELSKGQQGAVASMINEIIAHLESLHQEPSANKDVTAPKIAVAKPQKKAATK